MAIRRVGAAAAAMALVLLASGTAAAQSNLDFLVGQLNQRATQFAAGYTLAGPVQTGRLRQRGKKNFNFVLQAGQCYRVIGVGDQSVRDLDIFLRVRGRNVAEDTATDNFPVVSYCPTARVRAQVRVLMFAGQGEFAVGIFNGPPDGGVGTPVANPAAMTQRLASVAAQNAPGYVGLGAPTVGQLTQNTSQTLNVPMQQGGCYKFIAVGGAGVSDLDIHVNVNGSRVASDTATDDFPIASFCSPRRQTAQVQILMYRGNGGFAYQTFQSGAPQNVVVPVLGSNDYLSNRMREISGRYASGRAPVSPLMRGNLQTSQTQDFSVAVQAGHCYTVVGVGDPSVTDLDMFLFDQNGTQVAQDQATDNFPIVQICPNVPGNYRIQVKMYSGYGAFGLQVFGN